MADGTGKTKFNCLLCTDTFDNLSTMHKHYGQNHQKEEQLKQQLYCVLCATLYKKKGHLVNHMESVHPTYTYDESTNTVVMKATVYEPKPSTYSCPSAASSPNTQSSSPRQEVCSSVRVLVKDQQEQIAKMQAQVKHHQTQIDKIEGKITEHQAVVTTLKRQLSDKEGDHPNGSVDH